MALRFTLPLAGVAGGCTGPLSALDAAGPSAASIATLWWVMLYGSAVLFALTMVLLGATYLGRRLVAGVPERVWLVGGGLVLPGLVLAPLTVYGFVVGERTLPHPASDVVRVEAVGRMWVWDFGYPDRPAAAGTRGVLHIPAGRPVDVHITSADVIHSFWVPRLAGKLDAIPGQLNVLRIVAAQPGVYRGVCAEFCGRGHTGMHFVVEAHPPDDYAARLDAALAGPRR